VITWGQAPGYVQSSYPSTCPSDYTKLVHDIRKYFVKYPDAIEVLIFKGKNEVSVSRRFALSVRFYFEFKKMFEK
jgi:hypothetical protein